MRIRTIALAILIAASTFNVATAFAKPKKATLSAASLDERRKQLSDLIAAHWEWRLSHSPELASNLGDKRWNDKLSDYSMVAEEQQNRHASETLARLKTINTTGFPEQEALNKTILLQQMQNELDDFRLKTYEMPINQLQGAYLQVPQMVSTLQFRTAKDYTDWIARLRDVPRVFDQIIAMMRKGMADKLTPPRFLLQKTSAQIEGIARQKAEDTPFAQPLQKMPESISAEDKARIHDDLLAAINEAVLPAYAELAHFVREEYTPKGREHDGIWSLPDGDARYATAVRRATTTNLTPAQIHELGLQQVAEDEKQMDAIAKKLGFPDTRALDASINLNPDLHAKSREQILDLYRKFIAGMNEKLPQLFGRLPKATVEVMSVESFREKSAPGAQYQRGTKDGSRPGHVVVNTSEPTTRKIIGTEATAYHEGVPGHHLQNSIAQQLPDLPPFRQNSGFIAFGEGWALYAERLGKEVGLYQDPYFDYGRLQSDIFRAVRLVVDTGVHSKHWTRQQMVDYFHQHTNADEVSIQAEVDRYIAWPAQALGYKVGQLKILGLRDKAEKALGSKFDLREFHDEVLGAGSIPLDVLEQRIDRWIARKKGATSS
jgi:uncharacterized protein (DUF885 family)